MDDQSHLDTKYFIDESIYNCPFCNRRHVSYSNMGCRSFDWSNSKKCYVWFTKCSSCSKISMHLSYENLQDPVRGSPAFNSDLDIDSMIFYSVPTSFFTIDNRIPVLIRELITEAEGCVKMNYLTGASACIRKAIYEFIIIQKAEGDDYENRIKFLKTKYPNVDSELFDVLCHIKDMTSEKVHEQSWDKWDSEHLKLFIETLKAILHEIYVIPDERKGKSSKIKQLLHTLKKEKKQP